MKKSDILASFEHSLSIINGFYSNNESKQFLTDEQCSALNELFHEVAGHYSNLKDLDERTDDYDEKLKEFEEQAKKDSDVVEKLREKIEKLESVAVNNEENNTPKNKVNQVIPEEEQSEELKESCSNFWNIFLKIAAVLGLTATLLITVFICKYFDEKNNTDKDLPNEPTTTLEQVIPSVTKAISTLDHDNKIKKELQIGNLDLENQDDLVKYATSIQNKLGETDISKEEIISAIKLANLDALPDRGGFRNREEVYRATTVAGKIASTCGCGAIVQENVDDDIFITTDEMKDILLNVTDNEMSLSVFKDCSTQDEKYSCYKVFDKCVKGLKADNKNSFLYAKLLNDIATRKLVSFSLNPDSPISTYYVLIGLYNANKDRIFELTAGQSLSTIYGDGYKNDGTYGFMCVEELASFLTCVADKNGVIVNDQNGLLTFIVDGEILNFVPSEELKK